MIKGSFDFRGWRWLCPRCGREVNILYLPVPSRDLQAMMHYELRRMKDNSAAPASAVRRAAAALASSLFPHASSFACKTCSRVKYCVTCSKSSWGQIVAYLSGGLLYGNEVPRPEWFKSARQHEYTPRLSRQPSRRRIQIEQRLLAGLTINQIAAELKLRKGTILFYTTQIYHQHGVRCLRELLIKHGMAPRPGMRGPATGEYGDGRAPRRQRTEPRVTVREQIRQRTLAGESIQRIALALNITGRQVSNHL